MDQSATDEAPLTYQHQADQEAAREATLMSAPNTLTSTRSETNFMSGGRSIGDLQPSPEEAQANLRTDNPIEVALLPLTSETRPSLSAGQNHMSVQSISQLHVPGEFPKGGVS